jgi:DNA-binding transcriptional regulator YhcF (GntR family)
MSVEHLAMVFEADGLASNETLLLLAYANYTDAHGYCWPGMTRLAAMTGLSESTLKRTRKSLESKNLLRSQRRTSAAGDATSNAYRINLDKLRKMRRSRDDFDDNCLALEFADEPAEQASDQPIVHPEPTPGHPEPTGGHPGPRGGVTVTPYPLDRSVNESVRPDARAREPEPEGRTEDPLKITDEHRQAAAALVDEVDLSKVGARPTQEDQLRDALAAALAAGYPVKQVRRYLGEKLQEARKTCYLLEAFSPHRWTDIGVQGPAQRSQQLDLPPCDTCGARKGEPLASRQIETSEGIRRCPQCRSV